MSTWTPAKPSSIAAPHRNIQIGRRFHNCPPYWPDLNQFKTMDQFFGAAGQDLQDLRGMKRLQDALTRHLARNSGDHSFYEVAELTDPIMRGTIESAVTGTKRHQATAKGDKYFPSRMKTGAKAGAGTTPWDDLLERWGYQRLAVEPDQWQVLNVLVCKNFSRWVRYVHCQQVFKSSGMNAWQEYTDESLGMREHSRKLGWASKVDMRLMIDSKIGEMWLWSGQDVDICHALMSNGYQRAHCHLQGAHHGYGALGRGNYFTDKFSKAMMYALNLVNEYYGDRGSGADVRALMLSRVLLGKPRSADYRDRLGRAHNLELSALAQGRGNEFVGADAYRKEKTSRAAFDKQIAPSVGGVKKDYKIEGEDTNRNIGRQSLHMFNGHQHTNEFLVGIGKQVYPEFLVFVSRTAR